MTGTMLVNNMGATGGAHAGVDACHISPSVYVVWIFVRIVTRRTGPWTGVPSLGRKEQPIDALSLSLAPLPQVTTI